MTTAILKPIGKGQFTIPKAWRNLLNINDSPVEARLAGGEIIIKPLNNKVNLDIDIMELNTLPEEDQGNIKKGRKAYANKEWDKFMSFNEVFSDV